MVIEDGSTQIRNGRKLIKEDFTYGFNNFKETNKSRTGKSPS